MSRWSGPLFPTMGHIVEVPGCAQSRAAHHTVRRACACRPWLRRHCVTGGQSQCHRGHRATGPGHHSGWENSLKIRTQLVTTRGTYLTFLIDSSKLWTCVSTLPERCLEIKGENGKSNQRRRHWGTIPPHSESGVFFLETIPLGLLLLLFVCTTEFHIW